MEWRVVQEISVGAAVLSLSLIGSGAELIANVASGFVYRISANNLTLLPCGAGHTTRITCLAFGRSVGLFASGSLSGELRVWDIGDYACQAVLRQPKGGIVHSLYVMDGADEGALVSGWEDGSVRCHDLQRLSRAIWTINNAHRGGTTSVTGSLVSNPEMLVTGGADNAVRVWRLSTRELLAQFSEHTKAISRVLVDNRLQNIVHSVSLDGQVLSFDLKTKRRAFGHSIPKGALLYDVSQRPDSEQELVTCDSRGRILVWDCDIRDPVASVRDEFPIRSCAVSPSGAFLAFVGEDHRLKVVRMDSMEIVSVGWGHTDIVRTVAWTPDEKQIVTGGDDFSLCVWNFFLGGV